MADASVGEIRMWAGTTFVPLNWLPCDGRVLNISESPELFSLIGVTYGGDGKTTFGLPDLRGRVPVGQGQSPEAVTPLNYIVGMKGGAEGITLTAANTPKHNHNFQVTTTDATSTSPINGVLGKTTKGFYSPVPSVTDQAKYSVSMSDVTVLDAYGSNGATAAHNNVMPSLGMGFIICVRGFYPQRA